MMLCVTCGFQRPNRFKSYSCPSCRTYLKYVEAPAKHTVIKLHNAGLSVSYATAEVYSYAHGSVHTVNICIGLSQPYQTMVFRCLPDGMGYVLPHSHESLSHVTQEHILSPVRTYGLIRYETPYLDYKEAKSMLRQKLKELDAWVDDATADSWLAILHLGGLL